MRKIIIVFCLFLAAPAIAQTKFSSLIADFPIMTGLEEMPQSAVQFDKPEGRISQITLKSTTPKKHDIDSFYIQTLPQLGWNKVGNSAWRRDAEILRITVIEQSGDLPWVRVQVYPISR